MFAAIPFKVYSQGKLWIHANLGLKKKLLLIINAVWIKSIYFNKLIKGTLWRILRVSISRNGLYNLLIFSYYAYNILEIISMFSIVYL